ncbi:membrane fusion protein (multidrug efflux system) [Sphaerotilus hippei]|uniref:Membrane fusion protein (Multidrug efflux system) n=2 Tax=Sphaerotilus hippei TaxID=744406 RepID=A0A318H2D6_9BURK|nr:membrane fusion protein (multidrug efflux system) [Sphaerotilus hippei]
MPEMNTPRIPPVQRPRLHTLALLTLGAGLALGLGACSEGQAQAQAGKNAGAPPAAVEVGVVTLATQPLTLRTELAGRTVAMQSAEIRPQVSGILRQRLYTEGSMVKAGQALYQIDDASYRTELASAQAGVARAEATLQAAQLKARRQDELLAADAGTRQDAEDARASLAQAQADLKTAQATLATASLNLQRTRIIAPISGRIDTSGVSTGALVTASQTTALTTVQQLDPIWVDVPQSSVEMLKLRRQLASGTLDNGTLTMRLVLEDGSDYPHPGRLEVSGVSVNTTTGAVNLRARVPNPEGLLLPGMYVRAVLDQGQDRAALLVPQAGIRRNTRGEATALVVGQDSKVEQRAVTVAESVAGQWRVTQGLQAGERLIVEGSGKVRPGQIVHAVALSASAPAAAASATVASR